MKKILFILGIIFCNISFANNLNNNFVINKVIVKKEIINLINVNDVPLMTNTIINYVRDFNQYQNVDDLESMVNELNKNLNHKMKACIYINYIIMLIYEDKFCNKETGNLGDLVVETNLNLI